MSGRVVSSLESQKHHWSLTSALASALLEWLLIFMLLVYAIFGYLITKFARYCKLPVPCLLCSRIDHILGNEKVGFYWDLICGNHKLEISSSVFCHFHEKLVDVHGICESCLFSFATKDKSNAETYRLLVGKLGAEDLSGFDEDLLLDDHNKLKNSSMKHCSCCNELWTARSYAQTLLKTKSIGFNAADLDIPLDHEFRQDVDDLKMEAKTPYQSTVMKTEDSLVNFGYTELKITSDTESEIQASDNEDTRALISNDPLRDIVLDSTQIEPFINVSRDDSACNKPIDLDVVSPEPSEALCQVQSDIIEPHDGPSLASVPAIGHGLEELSWQAIDHKLDQPPSMELINLNHVLESSNGGNVSTDISNNGVDTKEAEIDQALAHKTDKIHDLETSRSAIDLNTSRMKSDQNDNGLQLPICLDLGDAYKLALSSRGRQLSSKLTEHLAGKDSLTVSEDLKHLLSQLSRGGFELPSNDILSPRLSIDSMKLLQKRLSLERNDSRTSLDRNESGFESLDLSEIEGESEVDRLKRQHDHDRKFMIALFKELEEERNASAIAANETMAMITRLQEEKAALQMEASHDLRMMEEQAEYDIEALEKLNSLVTEKDKEIQDLESELEYFRSKYPNESLLENADEMVLDSFQEENLTSFTNYSYGDRHGLSVITNLSPEDSSKPKDLCLEIEDEREYILQCLNNLEKKLNLLSSNTVQSDLINGDHLEKQEENSCDSNLHEECAKLKNKLDERLQALEADRNFLECVISTLNDGDEGLIREIASHLRELRRIGIR